MNVLKSGLSLFVLLFLQLFIFNNFLFQGFMNPYIYVVFILLLSPRTSPFYTLSLAFFIGALVDVFEGAYGVHTAATVFLAFIKPVIFQIFKTGKNDLSDLTEVKELGLLRSLGYIFIGLFLHHFVLFSIENFAWDDFGSLLIRSSYSSLFSFIFVLLHQLWNHRR
jgi:rod shape-determining protein MreD